MLDIIKTVLNNVGFKSTENIFYIKAAIFGMLIPLMLAGFFIIEMSGAMSFNNFQLNTFFISFIGMVILPSILEEVVFRGLLWRWVEMFLGIRAAFILTTAIFIAAHNDGILHMILITPLSILIAELRRDSGSIFPGMLSHAINNTFVILLQEFMSKG